MTISKFMVLSNRRFMPNAPLYMVEVAYMVAASTAGTLNEMCCIY